MKRQSLGIGMLLFLCLLFLPLAHVNAEQSVSADIRIVLDGEQLQPEVPPKLIKGRTLVPIRVIAEAFGSKVDWDEKSKTITVVYQSAHVSLEIGKKKALVNGKEVAMDVPPMIDRGRTLVPLRFVGESLGTTLEWDADHRMVIINRDKQSEETEPTEVKEVEASRLNSIEERNGRIFIESSTQAAPQHFLMEGPTRLVIDLPNTIIGEDLRDSAVFQNGLGIIKLKTAETSSIKASGSVASTAFAAEPGDEDEYEVPPIFAGESDSEPPSVIQEIRFSQFSLEPKTVRIVIQLSRKANYTLKQNENGYEIALQPHPKKEGFLVVLDPGHGGKDPGAKGVAGNFEKDLTLAISQMVKENLRQYKDIQVLETRADDTYPTLQERVQLSNEVEADMYLSIHANSFKPQTRGTETFYYTPQSAEMASIIHKHLLNATEFPDRGVKKSGFYVIKNTESPSSLIEIGFLSNAEENAAMLNPEFQEKVSKAIAEGIYEYYTSVK